MATILERSEVKKLHSFFVFIQNLLTFVVLNQYQWCRGCTTVGAFFVPIYIVHSGIPPRAMVVIIIASPLVD